MNSFTSSTRNRRCPPGVLTDFKSPRLAHSRTVTGATSSRSATWCGVKYSDLRPRRDGDESTSMARRTLPVDLCEFISINLLRGADCTLHGNTADRSADRINATIATPALQAYIAYFGIVTGRRATAWLLLEAAELVLVQSRHREERWKRCRTIATSTVAPPPGSRTTRGVFRRVLRDGRAAVD